MRGEFAEFRRKYRSYSDLLDNPRGKTLGELLDARHDAMSEVIAAINVVADTKTDSRLLSEIVGAQLKPGSDGDDSMLEIAPAISLTGLAKLGIKKIKAATIKGRASILFDVWAKAMKLRDYHLIANRRLGMVIDPHESKAYEAYAQAIEALARPHRGG